MRVSYSRVSKFLRCPYAHYLSYKLELEPNKPARPLFFGSDFHKLLEFRGQPDKIEEIFADISDTYYSMPSKFQSELGDDYVGDLKSIFEDYMDIYKDSPTPDVTEKKFSLSLGKIKGEKIILVGVIDGLYFTDGRDIILEEHKTFSSKPNMNTLVMNTQKCVYAHAVQKLSGLLPCEVMWDYIKSTPAKYPVWLEKSERFSEAKNSNITPYSWVRACEEKGVTDRSIVEKASNYVDNIPNFFFRVNLNLDEKMVNDVWRSFKEAIRLMYLNQDSKIKNITRDCSFCEFQPICYAEMSGGNVEYTIEKDFRHKE